MRILIIMDPGIPTPPPLYGGHERLVYMFAEEYYRLGHKVTILAGPDSYCSGKTVHFGINKLHRNKIQRFKELLNAWSFILKNKDSFDLIHNFGRLLYLLPVLNHKIKKIMTYGRPVSKKGIRLINRFSNRNLIFTACSNYCVSTGNVAGRWETVYNAIDFSKYNLTTKIDSDAPLMFLGRMDKIKGLVHAIKAAKATGHKLWIGGNVPDTPDNLAYFREAIEPQFDGETIIYLGPLNDEQKNNYLGKAKALLFPIEWDEPFGMVMTEAMACGTPVIGFRKGSVPEVIKEAVSGFTVSNLDGMIEKIAVIDQIDRTGCMLYAKNRFDVSVIAKAYLSIN